MAPKSSNQNTSHKAQIKWKFDKLKNNQIQHAKVDLTQINIQTLASQIDVLSDDVKLYMKLLTSNRYYDLDGRTINLLMKGDSDMRVVTDSNSAEESDANKESDGEVQELPDTEADVEFFVVDENKNTNWWSIIWIPKFNKLLFSKIWFI